MSQPTQSDARAKGAIVSAYMRRLDEGAIEPDAAQLEAVGLLDELSDSLNRVSPAASGLFRFFSRAPSTATPTGLYLHGGVGRGKTMLMDLFYEQVAFAPRQRMHFHEFMSEVHDRIGEARKTTTGDPIISVANDIAPAAHLLCFDELHVTDIADAMILGRLFTQLFANGTVLVATSNARPDELYKNGLNRQLFLPFIDLLERQVTVHHVQSAKDFRQDKLQGVPLYYSPVDDAARAKIDSQFAKLTNGSPVAPKTLHVKGRKLTVPQAAAGVGRFTFDGLCAQPLGPRDYLAVAHAFHTVLIDDIPILGPERRNEARRFINLIDALYDNGVGLIASAAAEPDDLYIAGDGSDLFTRTASRLMEMRSPTYLAQREDRAHAVKA